MLDCDAGPGGILKSQSPKRRKQAAQVASPDIWPSSACQPKRARVNAAVLTGSDEGVPAIGSDEQCTASLAPSLGALGGDEHMKGATRASASEMSKPSGFEGSVGSSEAIVRSDW